MALISLPSVLLKAIVQTLQSSPAHSKSLPHWQFRFTLDDKETIGYAQTPFDASNLFLMFRNLFAVSLWGGAEYLYALDKVKPFYSMEKGFELNGAGLGSAFTYQFIEQRSTLIMPRAHMDEKTLAMALLDICNPLQVDMVFTVRVDTTTLERNACLCTNVRNSEASYFLFEIASASPGNNLSHQSLNVIL